MTSLCDTRQSVLLCLALAYLSVFFSQDRIWKFHHTVPYDTSSSPFQICELGSTVRTGHILCIYFLLLMDLHTDWRVLWNHWHELSCASVWWADTLVFWGGMLCKSIISKSLTLKLTVYLDWQGSELEKSAPLCSLPSAQHEGCRHAPFLLAFVWGLGIQTQVLTLAWKCFTTDWALCPVPQICVLAAPWLFEVYESWRTLFQMYKPKGSSHSWSSRWARTLPGNWHSAEFSLSG